MRHSITLDNQNVSYTVRKSKRARRMRLAVYCDGAVVVTTPYGLRETVAERFVREKSRWLLSKLAYFKQFEGHAITRYSHEDYLTYKDQAYALAMRRVAHFNTRYGFSYNKISIKNQKTRWGSCSRKRNLNFNYKIVLLPPRLADYVIVHELCHLGEFNHSKQFWRLVEKGMPDYKKLQSEIKKIGLVLR